MKPPQWQEISPSQFAWEREALACLRDGLPDHEPYRAWSNFEFIADDGTINEVDLLVLGPTGLYLVEIKSRPGEISGDAHTWTWKTDGRLHSDDNPLFAANRKAKKLASLLRRQKSMERARPPFIDALVFCSAPGTKIRLSDALRMHVFGRDEGTPPVGGILSALTRRREDLSRQLVDAPVARAVARAMSEAGIRATNHNRRVGDYVLERVLFEHPSGLFQDWRAKHSSLADTYRMVRLYPLAPSTPKEQRATAQKVAEREFRVLQPLEHEGILLAETITAAEAGPALVFRLGANAVRFDHFMKERGASLTFELRLELLRQIAEALDFTHGRKVAHRRLAPQSIYVVDPQSAVPRLKVFNWQLGQRLADSSTGSSRITSTIHASQVSDDAGACFLAPEVFSDPDCDGVALDVFGLGALAYYIFSGRAPADSPLETSRVVIANQGLDLGAVVDGAPRTLCELVRTSTLPAAHDRYSRVREYLTQLDSIEEEYTRPEVEKLVSPLEAKPGDRLAHGLVVRSRLGSGSTATAFLVARGEREMVLKVASKPEHCDRIVAEFETMQKLRHPRIVEVFELLRFTDLPTPLVGFLAANAGPKTLAQHLREYGLLSLDFLERFGTDLIESVCHLEEEGFAHRDIKPENIGIRAGNDGSEHLVLFDFSLTSVSPDNIRCGTTVYLDPFLADRKPARWDNAAERYSAALTLYEMATGSLPKWGDGQSHPSALKCAISIEANRFDPSVREDLESFFAQAFHRDYRKRFDNAHDMLTQWRGVFSQHDSRTTVVPPAQSESGDRAALVEAAKLDTQLIYLGISNRAANALDRAGLVTVEDFLLYPVFRLNRLRGVGKKTVRELAELHFQLRPRFPNVRPSTRTRTPEAPTESTESAPSVSTPELLEAQLLAGSGKGAGKGSLATLRAILGLPSDEVPEPPFWLSQTEAARLVQVSRQYVGQIVTGARDRWRRNRSLTALREEIAELIQAQGGAMTPQEIAQAILLSHGSALDEPLRSRSALAVVRAAMEAEYGGQTQRFIESRNHGRVVLALSPELADYAFCLGDESDALAQLDPLAMPQRVLERLRSIPPPVGISLISDTRLLNVAVANSRGAALSSRLEIYPKGMEAKRVLQLAQGVLFATGEISAEEIARRVKARYPEAAPLPPRPVLDGLLKDLGSRLDWNPKARNGSGAFCPPTGSAVEFSTGSTTSAVARTSVHPSASDQLSPSEQVAREFDERLRHSHAQGTFLVLMVSLKEAQEAERALRDRFNLVHRNCDELLIRSLREQAASLGARWDVVLNADGTPPGSSDWNRLQTLVRCAVDTLPGALAAPSDTVLLTQPGLLARYDRLEVLDRLRDEIGRTGSPVHGLWVLVPCDDQHVFPTLHQRPLRVTSAAQWARIPSSWLRQSRPPLAA